MAGFAAARWYLDTPENHLPVDLNALFPDHLRCSKQPDYSVVLSHSRADRPRCDCPSAATCTTNRPTSTLGLVATSILILIVARFSP